MSTTSDPQPVIPIMPLPPPAAKRESPEQRARRAARDRARKVEKRGKREAARPADHKEALAYAQELVSLADEAPDADTRKEINKIVNRLRLRWSQAEDVKRDAVLAVIEKWSIGVSRGEIMEMTGLGKDDVQAALDSLTSPAVDLVTIFDRGGKNNSGRGGTKLYYKMKGHE